MARPTTKPEKEPGRLKQMWQVFQMTRRYDSSIVWLLILCLAAPIGAGIILGVVLSRTNVLGLVLYIITGVLAGVLIGLIVLGRRAEKAAYGQIAGEPGAVGAVLKSGLRRSWTGSEMPVNVSPRTQDAIYRAVGRGGVVLIGEGPRSRTQPMLDKERANVHRILPNVPVNFLYVGPDPDATPLHRIVPKMARYKNVLTKAEVLAVSNRLTSLGKNGLPIPKGIDPTRVRAPRPR
ncbi:DUF4191 domain-containing protein [Lysinimonas soli]|uniref:DUF4191 domain-containing protein n=1 Tax=Lysinimonas soli TaxID=1074233 RepID=A0ABW0NN37_9MICO